MTIPKRPPPGGDMTVGSAIDFWRGLSVHEHAVAKVAVEALRELDRNYDFQPTAQMTISEALAAIEQSGWKPE